jgi:hypothetical protein
MADTKSVSEGQLPIESDGVSYRGIVWFIAIIAITTIVCEFIVVGMFKVFETQGNGAARAPLAAPAGTLAPPPNLLMDEPANLTQFRTSEEAVLHSYSWQDKNAGTVRLPIARAKELLLERGLPTRGAAPSAIEPVKAPAPAAAHKAPVKDHK